MSNRKRFSCYLFTRATISVTMVYRDFMPRRPGKRRYNHNNNMYLTYIGIMAVQHTTWVGTFIFDLLHRRVHYMGTQYSHIIIHVYYTCTMNTLKSLYGNDCLRSLWSFLLPLPPLLLFVILFVQDVWNTLANFFND